MATLKFLDGNDVLTFTGPTTGITTTYAAQRLEMIINSRAQLAVLISYTKGDETYIEVGVELSPDVTNPVTNPATGTDYYFFSSLAGSGAVTEFPFQITTVSPTKVRIPIQTLHQERMLRLSVRRVGGSDAGAGEVSLRVVDDSHSITSAIAGRDPSEA